MIIELCGLPGSGKTSFAKYLEENKAFKRVKLDSKMETLKYFLSFLLKYPAFSLIFIKFILFSGQNLKSIWSAYFVKTAKYMKAIKEPSDFCVIDEGLFQNFLTFAGSRPLISDFSKTFNKIPEVADYIIFFELEKKERVLRLKKRSERFGRSEVIRSKKQEESMERVFSLMIDLAKQNKRCLFFDSAKDERGDFLESYVF